LTKSVFVPRGIDVPSLDQDRLYDFKPNTDLKVGDLIVGGDFVGKTYENDLFSEHRIMLSPKLNGRIVEVFPTGEYNCSNTVMVIEKPDGK